MLKLVEENRMLMLLYKVLKLVLQMIRVFQRVFLFFWELIKPKIFGQSRKARNVPSSLLTQEENQKVFDALGKQCTTLATAVVQLYHSEKSNSSCDTKCSGVICFVEDCDRCSYSIKLFDMDKGCWVWEQELDTSFTYKPAIIVLYICETDNCAAVLNFTNKDEALNFKYVVQKKLQQRDLWNKGAPPPVPVRDAPQAPRAPPLPTTRSAAPPPPPPLPVPPVAQSPQIPKHSAALPPPPPPPPPPTQAPISEHVKVGGRNAVQNLKDRGDFLSQIRKGCVLKPVSEDSRPAQSSEAEVLAKALLERTKAIHHTDESGSSSDEEDGDDWD